MGAEEGEGGLVERGWLKITLHEAPPIGFNATEKEPEPVVFINQKNQ